MAVLESSFRLPRRGRLRARCSGHGGIQCLGGEHLRRFEGEVHGVQRRAADRVEVEPLRIAITIGVDLVFLGKGRLLIQLYRPRLWVV